MIITHILVENIAILTELFFLIVDTIIEPFWINSGTEMGETALNHGNTFDFFP